MKAPENKNETLDLFRQGPGILDEAIFGLSEKELDYTPAKGGWNIRQIIHHIVDGDEIWKYCIRMAMGGTEPEFSLKWYQSREQTDWANDWHSDKRPIDEALELLSANKKHTLQLLEYDKDAWEKSVKFLKSDGGIEMVPIGAAVQIQADHVVHHVKRIKEILEEIVRA